MKASVRSDLFYGAVYGLALSALVWSVVLAPPTTNPDAALLGLVGLTLGCLGLRWGTAGRLSPVYPVALAALVAFGPGYAVVLTGLAALAQNRLGPRAWARRRNRFVGFEVSVAALAAALAAAAWQMTGATYGITGVALHIGVYAAVRVLLERLALALTGRRIRVVSVTSRCVRAVVGAILGVGVGALLVHALSRPSGPAWLGVGLLILASMVLYRSRLRLRRQARRDALKRSGLFHAFVQSWSSLTERKDADNHRHARRVQRIALELGLRLGISERQREALAAASILHDVGTLAIPDAILNKPGRLTSEEMARVREHAEIGASLLDDVPFPHPVASVVRHHHERWDGRGYPAGLRGTEIPLAARILSVVETYNALTSDRPYRRAVRVDEAATFLHRESGHRFDPDVVEAMLLYLEDHSIQDRRAVPVSNPEAPATPAAPSRFGRGDDATADRDNEPAAGCLPRSQRELRTLYEIAGAQSYRLSFDEYLTLVACKLAELVPYQSMVAYLLDRDEQLLRARFAIGKAGGRLRLMTIPLGERVTGWCARHRRSFIGNDHRVPLDRDGGRCDLEDWDDDPEIAALGSTLVAPICDGDAVVGVLTLYDDAQRHFTEDDRRVLGRVAGYVSEVARRHEKEDDTGETSLTDPLTGVPNARFLWIESGHRISQSPGGATGFGLMAFRVGGLETASEKFGTEEADRLLCLVARRFAASCRTSETLVRFGQELFMVLTPMQDSGELVARWHELIADVEQPTLTDRDGGVCRIRLTAAHASAPADGNRLERLLEALDERLGWASQDGRTVLPFRTLASVGDRTA